MNVMIVLPGEKYFAIPRDVLEKYAVPKVQFDSELAKMEKRRQTVFSNAPRSTNVPNFDHEKIEESERVVVGVRG